MILAAGLGTRLRPLTDRIPKALVPIEGVPILERVIGRLIDAGVDHLVINLHHHAEQIRAFVEDRNRFGIEIDYSLETERPLDTGGGLKHAAGLFRGGSNIIVHNVDVLSDIDLAALRAQHQYNEALATLAVRPSSSDRYLLAGDDGVFCGYGSTASGDRLSPNCASKPAPRRVDFCGIHVLRGDFFDHLTEHGIFSVIYAYHRLAGEGQRIQTHDVGDAWWIDIGTHEALAEARAHFAG